MGATSLSRPVPGARGDEMESTVRLLTVEQVAELLNLGAHGAVAVRVLDAAGRGPISYQVGAGALWCRSDVLDWLRENSPRAVLLQIAAELHSIANAFDY
jgi:hypothetical protein